MPYSVFASTTQIPKTTPKTTPETTLKRTQIPIFSENRQSQMPYSVFETSTTEIPYSVHMSTTQTSPDESFHLIDAIADLTEASIVQSTDLKSANLNSKPTSTPSPSQSTKVPSQSSLNPNESNQDDISVKSTTVSTYSEEKLESRTSNSNIILTEPTQGKVFNIEIINIVCMFVSLPYVVVKFLFEKYQNFELKLIGYGLTSM